MFTAAGNGPSRLRLINGLGLEVLPRLTDGGYDLVFVDTSPVDHARYLEESVRLLRPGGIVVINGALDAVVPDGFPGPARRYPTWPRWHSTTPGSHPCSSRWVTVYWPR